MHRTVEHELTQHPLRLSHGSVIEMPESEFCPMSLASFAPRQTIAGERALSVTPRAAKATMMTTIEIHAALNGLRRPRLLVDAARHAMVDYRRRHDLRRMLRIAIPTDARAALRILVPMEADLERRRQEQARGYSHARHVDILTALMAEARDFKARKPHLSSV